MAPHLATFASLVYCQPYTIAAERPRSANLLALRSQGKIREN
jgi:hypothetical protein